MMFDLIKGQQKLFGEMYGQVFDLYKGLVDPEEFSAENIMEVFSQPNKLMETCLELYKNMMQPWMQLDEKIMEEAVAGDPDAYVEFFDQVIEKYDSTFGKVVKMMNMGINLEAVEEQQKTLDAYYQFVFSAGKLAAIMSKSNQDSLKSLTEKYLKLMEEGQDAMSFNEFYNLWYVTSEKAMEELFATATFSKAFAEFSDKYFKYLAATNTVLERNLSKLPIPTNKDMNSLYFTVYNLRKDVRDLKKQSEIFTKSMFSSKERVSKAE